MLKTGSYEFMQKSKPETSKSHHESDSEDNRRRRQSDLKSASRTRHELVIIFAYC